MHVRAQYEQSQWCIICNHFGSRSAWCWLKLKTCERDFDDTGSECLKQLLQQLSLTTLCSSCHSAIHPSIVLVALLVLLSYYDLLKTPVSFRKVRKPIRNISGGHIGDPPEHPCWLNSQQWGPQQKESQCQQQDQLGKEGSSAQRFWHTKQRSQYQEPQQ